jgi:hypothetical protein
MDKEELKLINAKFEFFKNKIKKLERYSLLNEAYKMEYETENENENEKMINYY